MSVDICRKFRCKLLWGVASAIAMGCRGGGTSTSPTPTPSTPTSTTTITITNNAVSPRAIVVPLGSRVTFVNNDPISHEMDSDAHPEHADCPEINQVGFLAPGQSRQTGNLNTPGTCGYHDHEHSTVQTLQGTITVQ